MSRRRSWFAILGVAVAALLLGAAAAAPAPVRALLVTEYANTGGERVAILSLTGKRLPVPPRVARFPHGLSPDGRLVAAVRDGSVLVGRVRSGELRTALANPCGPHCAYFPSYAWSPDSRRLAVSAGGLGQPSVLRIVDPSGRPLRSFAVPRANPEVGGPAAHRVRSWSPDGSRLLLERFSEFGSSAALVLDIATGTLRKIARFAACDAPRLAWSPDGRFVAMSSGGTHDCLDHFALIDANRGRTVVSGHWDKGEGKGGTVWAPDGKSIFAAVRTFRSGRVSSRIDRVDLKGRRVTVIPSRQGWLTAHVALGGALLYAYDAEPEEAGSQLLLYRFATRRSDGIASSGTGFVAVAPLARLP